MLVPFPSRKNCTVAAASGDPEIESTMVPLMVPVGLCEKENKAFNNKDKSRTNLIRQRIRVRCQIKDFPAGYPFNFNNVVEEMLFAVDQRNYFI
jgi:hypothetical protein